MNKQLLILEQTDRKIAQLLAIEDLTVPSSGWIKAIRLSLGMSLRQLGNKIGITAQSTREIEKREISDTISIKVLKHIGNSLDMKFVYGFIPRSRSLESMIELRAQEIAREIVARTSVTMKLEDQENHPERLRKAVEIKAAEIRREMPRFLWD